MKRNEPFWHDGNIESLEFTRARGHSIRIVCSLYANLDTRQRELWEVRIAKPTSWVVVATDLRELVRHEKAGAISDGVLCDRDGEKLLRLTLAEGYLEVRGGVVRASRMK